MKRLLVIPVLVLGLVHAGCSSDPTTSDEYETLRGELEGAQRELAAVTADRDSLQAERAVADERFALSNATIDAIGEITSDPSAYGTEGEVLELLRQHYVPGAITHDLAYGRIDVIEGWDNTLFGGQVDAVTTEWHNWVCDDGSQGGSLWTWEGTNFLGEPFELIGVALAGFNEKGINTGATVMWPYPDEYVWQEFGVRP